MALPNSITSTTPLGSDLPSTIDDQIRALKLAVQDILGIPNATAISAAGLNYVAGGLDRIIFQDAAASPTATGRLQRNGTKLEYHDGTAARVLARGTSEGQIIFPASQNASADANTLDDYEEGDWTPSVGGTATYTTQVGKYTKIGRLVVLQCDLLINAIGTGSQTTITGAPFTSSGTGGGGSVAAYWSGSALSITTLVARIGAGSASVLLWSTTAAATELNLNNVLTSTTSVNFTLGYIV